MHLGRFHHAIHLLAVEYSEKKINEKFSQVVNALNTVSTTPNNPDIAKQFKTSLDDLRTTLVASKLNTPRPVLASILNSISANCYIGEALFSRIKSTIDTNQLAPAMAVQELQKVQKEVQVFFAHITSINNAFTELEVEYDVIDDGEAEIGLLIPSRESSKTLKELGKEVNQWHNSLSAIAEVFDPDNNPITIRIFSTTDWMFYLCTTPPTLFGISLCLKGINQILSDLIRSKKLIVDLAGTGTSEALIKQLEKDHDGKLVERLNSLAEKIVDENYAGTDTGRKNELKISVRQGINSLAEKVATGSKVELKLKAPARPESVADGEQTEEQLNKIAEIERLEKLEIDIDNDASLILFDGSIEDISGLLPSPDEQDNS